MLKITVLITKYQTLYLPPSHIFTYKLLHYFLEMKPCVIFSKYVLKK